jgi:LPXTG-motif cell wall-anchored protein
MGSVWGLLSLVVIAGFMLAYGLAQHSSAFLIVGFLLMAIAGIFGAKGRLPEQH